MLLLYAVLGGLVMSEGVHLGFNLLYHCVGGEVGPRLLVGTEQGILDSWGG